MFRRLSRFVAIAYGDIPKPVNIEKWAERCAPICSADQAIAGAIISSFAKNYEDWTTTGWTSNNEIQYERAPKHWHSHVGFSKTLSNSKKGINLLFKGRRLSRDGDNLPPKGDFLQHVAVNDVELDFETSLAIAQAWIELTDKRAAMEAAAALALREQKATEAKWNIAENLLGMKRNEYGALVPKESVECSQ